MASESEDGILIRSMKLEDFKEVKTLLGNCFYTEEPLCKCRGKTMERDHRREHDDYLISRIKEGNCIVAVDETNGDHIVGIIIAGAQVPKSGTFSKFHLKIEAKANLFERYKVSKVLYLHIICVSATMRGKGLGSRLTQALMDVGRSKGISHLTAFCTSFYASRHMQALGMECAYSVAFTDIRDNNDEIIFQPSSPHSHVKVMVGRL